MLSYGEDVENKIVEITVSGKIKRDEFQDIAAKIEQRIADWGDLRLLKRVDSFEGMEAAVLIDDLKFAFNHFRDIKKVAVVTEKDWAEKLTEVGQLFVPFEVRCFENEQIDDAREWLR